MQLTKSKKGLTLVEIIMAMAILGILIVFISSMLNLSNSLIFVAGSRTQEMMEVQKIADGLRANTQYQEMNQSVIETFVTGLGADATVTQQTFSSGGNTWYGYEVTIKKIFKSNHEVQVTTYIINNAIN